MKTLKFDHISRCQIDKLRTFLKAHHMEGDNYQEHDAGTFENDCFSGHFNYNEKQQELLLTPTQVMPNLTERRLRKVVQFAATNIDYPHQCAVYNWVLCYIINKTDGALTYSRNATDHGYFLNQLSKIPVSDKSVQAFQNRGAKDAVVGCFGKVDYTLSDGVTTLEISYGVNTLSATNASAGLQGPGTIRWQTIVDKGTHFGGACAYLVPTITIEPAS